MRSIFIIHGISGSPAENWFPWLRQQLEAKGDRVIVPAFPHADRPMLKEWLLHFDEYLPLLDDQTILIGHSLGAAFVLRVLEKIEQPIHAAFLVAPAWGVMGNQFDPLMTTFMERGFQWETIQRHCKNFTVFSSENDPYIKRSASVELVKILGAKDRLIADAGHFNAGSGYTRFPQLIEEIQGF